MKKGCVAKMRRALIRIGTAGWTVPYAVADLFPTEGTHLQRYAAALNAAEINSSFYRPHKPQLYAKWAASVPPDFRFAVKLPKVITHEKRLKDVEAPLNSFCQEITGLGEKLGCILVQLPPSFKFDPVLATAFFTSLRSRTLIDLACEPRHPTWFTPSCNTVLKKLGIARVAADPARVPAAALPGGALTCRYYRLHGSPRMYYSEYSAEYLDALASDIKSATKTQRVWCFFDNTASGMAAKNALDLTTQLALNVINK